MAVAASSLAVLVSAGCASGHRAQVRSDPRPAVVHRRVVIGRSVEGRAIRATEVGDPSSPRRLLVVGCIHGDESAGIAVARALERRRTRGLDVWIIDDLNPDGVAAHRRQNAHGVDLNRNFPWRWRPLGRRGDQQFSGPRPLSEPESRFAYSLVRRVRPALSVWFHQPLDVVDESGGDVAVERRFAVLTGMRARRLTRYPGSLTGWENHSLPHGTAFVVELPPRTLSARRVRGFATALERLGRNP